MIRLVQRRLIIPRGDTGSFSLPVLPNLNTGNAAVFTIMDLMRQKKIYQKQITDIDGDTFTVRFEHEDTVNMPVGKYYWDIKFYQNPVIADNIVIDGDEIDSYYAAFTLPECEVRQTGDKFLTADDAPTSKLDENSLNLATAIVAEANITKNQAVESASSAANSAEAAANSASAAAQSAIDAQASADSIIGDVDLARHYAEQAEASASAASSSEDAAAASETAASTYASNALNSANSASASAITATEQAGLAEASANAAANSENVALQAKEDAISAKDAADSYASAAENSANNASNSASSAATSATSASNSATSAATSAITATAQATLASQSATSAVNSKNAAEQAQVSAESAQNAAEEARDNAAASATSAANSAETAASKADIASQSAISANTSKNAAATSAATASQMATTATNAATSAANSATSASQSATDANAAKVSAENAASAASTSASSAEYYASQLTGLTVTAETLASTSNATATYNSSTGVLNLGIPKGVGISNIELNPDYTLTISLDNNTSITTTSIRGEKGEQGDAFHIVKTYNSIAAMNADYSGNDVAVGEFVMIASTVEDPDNAKVYVKGDQAYVFVVDMSGATGLNGIGITNIAKTGTQGLVDTYTITYTNGTTSTFTVTNGNEYTILVQANQPTQPENKIWIPLDQGATLNLLTADEIEEEYVKKTDYATQTTAGVVKVPVDGGLYIWNNGYLTTYPATNNEIKAGTQTYRTIIPEKQHLSVFYGLATAAGDTTQSQSNNAVGTYTAEAKAAIQQMLDVPSTSDIPNVPITDIQVNGTSIVTNKIANIVMNITGTNSSYGISVSSGILRTFPAIPNIIKQDYNTATEQQKTEMTYRPITPRFQNESTFYGLAKAAGDTTQSQSDNAVGTYTNEAKAAIQSMLDVPSTSDLNIYATKSNTVLETTLSRGRKEGTTVKVGSFAFGNEVTASGNYSFAIGMNTTANGRAAYAEGVATIASGQYSHAGGNSTVASGFYSYSGGFHTVANLKSMYVFGEYNVISSQYPTWTADTQYNVGDKVYYTTNGSGYECLEANSDSTFDPTKWKDIAFIGKEVFIIGNGISENARSNALALDHDGTGHYKGNVYINCNSDSTGGSKVLCEADFATAQDIQNIINGGAGA